MRPPIIVKFEVDARMDEAEVPEDPNRTPCYYLEPAPSYIPATEVFQYPGCVVIAKGTVTKQEQLVEMKSGKMERSMQQMWFGRTPNCIAAQGKPNPTERHTWYTYKKIETKQVLQCGEEKAFESWEAGTRSQDQYQDKD